MVTLSSSREPFVLNILVDINLDVTKLGEFWKIEEWA